MQICKILLMAVVFTLLPMTGMAADAAHGGDGEHHGLPLYAVPLVDFGFFKITNSMVVTWVVAVFLIVFAQIATRNIKRVPEGAQNFWD